MHYYTVRWNVERGCWWLKYRSVVFSKRTVRGNELFNFRVLFLYLSPVEDRCSYLLSVCHGTIRLPIHSVTHNFDVFSSVRLGGIYGFPSMELWAQASTEHTCMHKYTNFVVFIFHFVGLNDRNVAKNVNQNKQTEQKITKQETAIYLMDFQYAPGRMATS